ncbi:MAG: FtsW/RodA/SpoVE family cell cycle protein [Rickettsiales bacterium]|nr:FtsW/RodA/SpoVE family cell cycle protein [Rickettsiales bacterium]
MKRSDRSWLTNWWFQIDWWIFGLVAAFCFIGILCGISSPRLFHKTVFFYAASAAIFLVVPMIGKKMTVNAAWMLLGICMGLFAATYLTPHVIHGSRRWFMIFGWSVMPADLLKPAFVVLTSWFLAHAKRREPADWIGGESVRSAWACYGAAFAAMLAFMFFHPDLGNMFMYLAVFGAMIFWLGAKWRYIAALGLLGVVAGAVSMAHSHFRLRLGGGSDGWQAERALDAIRNGGLWGRGEESFLFQRVPMANNDFVFSHLAEMWGGVACAALLAAMFWMFALLFKRSVAARDDFSSLVIFGAAMFFALHVMLNVLTAAGVIMKGTTLPFISYGGSSLVGFSLLLAVALGAIRREKWGGS